MKSFAYIVRIAGSALVLALCTFAGCKKSINGTQPSLLTTVRVSLSSTNGEGNLDAINDSIGISNDGRYIAFTSKATNLIDTPVDTNNAADVFLRDNLNRTLALVSISLTNGIANGASGSPSLSGDGRYVAFTSFATNLTVDAVPPGKKQVFVRDMLLGQTVLVSRSSGASGLIGDDDSSAPRISNDGVYVVFQSLSNLLDGVPAGGDDNDTGPNASDIYRRKVIDGTSAFPTDLVSMASTFAPGSGAANKGNLGSTNPCISGDGRFVAFTSAATNLVSASQDGGPDTNGVDDVFVRDCNTFRTVRCSVEYVGSNPTLKGLSRSPTITLDGQLVAFSSLAGNLNPAAQEQTPNIYIRSWNGLTPFTEVLSVHTSGATGGASCDKPTISGDGSRIAWQSASSALVNGDSNGVEDIFLRNRILAQTSRESVQTFGGQLDGQSSVPSYSADGRYIVFWSKSTNVVDDDTNGAADIFLRGPPITQ